MNLQFIILSSFALFLLGIFGLSFYRSFLSSIIAFQFIIFSATINFFGFSLFLYNSSAWDKTFIFFAFASIYLLLFLIVFYNYSMQTGVYELDVKKDFRFFIFSRSDWWGEDRIGDD